MPDFERSPRRGRPALNVVDTRPGYVDPTEVPDVGHPLKKMAAIVEGLTAADKNAANRMLHSRDREAAFRLLAGLSAQMLQCAAEILSDLATPNKNGRLGGQYTTYHD